MTDIHRKISGVLLNACMSGPPQVQETPYLTAMPLLWHRTVRDLRFRFVLRNEIMLPRP